MELHTTPSLVKTSKRRLGQGHGSGRVKTSGRGTKGQKARGKIPLRFEGGALALIKRLPFQRGKDRNKSFKIRPIAINLEVISLLPANSVVDVETLIKHKLVPVEAKNFGIKLLGNGEVKNVYTVKVPASKSAVAKIEKAGGSVEGTK